MEDTAVLTKKQLNDISAGLFLMIIFTAIWVAIGEATLFKYDHGIAAGGFAIIIIYMIICCINVIRAAKEEPEDAVDEADTNSKAKDKRFYIIFAVEGIAILAAKNILANTGHDDLFFPVFALIVGLHFFPMGKVFKNMFYYVLGVWICLVAAVGYVLIQQGFAVPISTGVIGIGCALATAGNGVRLIQLSGFTGFEL